MASYRDVPAQDVIDSIELVHELLSQNSTGPECDKAAATVLNALGTLTTDVAQASDISFADAIRSSGLGALLRMDSLLVFHALNNTDGIGHDAYMGLLKWGGLSGASTADYRPLDQEVDTFLAASYAKKIAESAGTIEGYARVLAEMSERGQENEAVKTAGKAFGDMMIDILNDAGNDVVDAHFLGLGLYERNLLVSSAEKVCGMERMKLKVTCKEPLDLFGIVIEEMRKGADWEEVMQKSKALIDQVQEFAAPYWTTDDVQMTAIGMITEDMNDAGGIVIHGTQRVAQALADAFPDQVVKYRDGTIVPPTVQAKAKPATTLHP